MILLNQDWRISLVWIWASPFAFNRSADLRLPVWTYRSRRLSVRIRDAWFLIFMKFASFKNKKKLRSIWDAILVAAWLHFPSPNQSRSTKSQIQRGIKKHDLRIVFLGHIGSMLVPKKAPKLPRGGGKPAPRGPREGPRDPQNLGVPAFWASPTPRSPRRPKSPQNLPKPPPKYADEESGMHASLRKLKGPLGQ